MKPSLFSFSAFVLVCGLFGQEADRTLPGDHQALATNQCVACHRDPATMRQQPVLMAHRFQHWFGSVHGRNEVSCDRCHGGDPAAKDQAAAHKGVAPPSVATSRIYYRNLPETCGACHQKVVSEFELSDHFRNLKADRLAPTCTTCHGFQMEIANVRPDQIVERCATCHNSRMNVHPEIGKQLEDVLAALRDTEATVGLASLTVQLAGEEGIATKSFESELEAARKRLRATSSLWHRFDLQSFATELREIRVAAEAARQLAREALLRR